MSLNNEMQATRALVRLLGATLVFSPVLGLPARVAKLVLQHFCIRQDRALSWMLVYCLLGVMMPLTYWLENMIFKRVTRNGVSLWAWFNKCGQDLVDALDKSRNKQ